MADEKEQFSLPKAEEEILKFWEEHKIFEKSLEATHDKQPFTFYDGPPFATGLPHYGHILASTIKDVIGRYQTMNGRFVRRRWGWDCHGLPIEEIVERKLGISGKKQIEEIGIAKFNEICRSTVLQYVEEWGKMVRRMGRWVEFDDSYKTMDRDYMESVWWGFKQIYEKGLVYEGRKVLLYCPRCETPISNFEVAMDNSYRDVNEESVYVKFKIKDQKSKIKNVGENTCFLAWTTTPWTLPGNVALAVGRDIQYVRAKVGEETLILAKDLAEKVLPVGYVIAEEIAGRDLVGVEYESLFNIPAIQSDKAFKVYAADFVTTEDGTGVVHTAVVYGEDDYALGVREGLPVVPLLDEKGNFNDKAPEFLRGQYFKKTEKFIKDDLDSRGLLLKREMHMHSYPHCWRCSTALFYNAIPAWFVNVQNIKPALLETNNKEINWFPGHLKHGRYEKSVEAAPDWNISRNRYWGNPIPVWKCEACAKNKVVGSIAELDRQQTTFYFVRHGEAEQNVLGIASSYPEQKPYDLTERGVKEAHAAAEKIKALGVDLIFSSDLTRTKHTADIIGSLVGIEVITDPRLREIDVGIWNGKPGVELQASWTENKRWSVPIEGGESHAMVQARMLEFVNEAAAKYTGKKIVIVSHGDPLWLARRHFGIEEYPLYAEVAQITTDIPDLHRPYIDHVTLVCDCGGVMRRTPEIFDSWVEAGSMPFSEYHYPFQNKDIFESRFPAQFVAEYIAQTRAWFYVMHVISEAIFGHAPFQNVVTTGTILAEDGSKMSKSKNNFPDPWVVIHKYGVDSLRFYLMNSVVMQADNLSFSIKDLENVYRKIPTILINVCRYFTTYAEEAHWQRGETSISQIIDRWILTRTKELVIETTESLDSYNTIQATRAIEGYVNDLSTWYLRRSRGRKDAAFFETFSSVLTTISKLLAPITPHLAEIIYRELLSKSWTTETAESVHLASWPTREEFSDDEGKLLNDMAIVREVASGILALRSAQGLSVRQAIASVSSTGVASIEVFKNPELAKLLCEEVNAESYIPSLPVEEGVVSLEASVAVGEVRIDTRMTEELKIKGLTRNLERSVQELRKKMGFKVGELATLRYATSDPEFKKAFVLLNKEKTYLANVYEGESAGGEAIKIDSKEAVVVIEQS